MKIKYYGVIGGQNIEKIIFKWGLWGAAINCSSTNRTNYILSMLLHMNSTTYRTYAGSFRIINSFSRSINDWI